MSLAPEGRDPAARARSSESVTPEIDRHARKGAAIGRRPNPDTVVGVALEVSGQVQVGVLHDDHAAGDGYARDSRLGW